MPVIPGAHLKGVLRHHCERLVGALGLEVVSPHSARGSEDLELVRNFRPLSHSELLVDRLFGTRYQGECLFVSNAVARGDPRSAETAIVARTAIDRVTGTAKENHLFTTEIVEGGSQLFGTVRGRHPGGVLTQEDEGFPYEYSLLVAALLSLDVLGADKSTGLGRCEVCILAASLRWNGEEVSVEDALSSFQETEWKELLEMLREDQLG